jgi:sugar/nucleoside kinase (ribokinase family)
VRAVAITGYASLDYVVRLDRAPVADATSTIVSRPLDWPRLGGSPAYVASAMVAAGVDALPISWVADDADGCAYCDALANRGVSDEGIAVSPGRTPTCVLAYQPDGGCHCFYHPSLAEPLALDAHQLELVAEAPWVCLTVGPPGATRQALAAIHPDAKLVWAVKADPRAVPAELAAAICARADIVAASRAEASFVATALAAAGPSQRRRLLVETRGAEGVALMQDGRVELFPVAAVEADDTTGAGDTFLGGFLASLIVGNEAPERAVGAGAQAARQMLLARGLVKKGY